MESLRPNCGLLDPKFEGYKLSLDPLLLSSTNLGSAVNDIPLKEELFSVQHMRAFGNLNHLVLDSWMDGGKPEVVYFVNENYEVQRAVVKDKDISSVDTVFKIPSVDKTKDNLNAALLFPSQSLACLSDGCGKLFLLQTESRTKDISQSTEWKVATVYQFNHPSLLLHALQSQQTGSVSCLSLSITENEAATSVKDAHVVHLELITFSPVTCLSSGAVSYSSEMLQQFIGYSAPVYAAIEPGCTAVLVASERPFSLAKR
ncbi:NudC domain-containing protein 1 [Desmophyllum pertusum]|uniref:NudC domain-containing protein 1 n=1 Tax=Desmophyllum pertusum TaxID=174260 RepID=A0A9W9YP61_9CNID|nr:NudC domain-containing protein 1 [Desmophyllum pertusum]